MDSRLRRGALAVLLAAVLGATALIFAGTAAADSSTAGVPDPNAAPATDPLLTLHASVPLTTPAGTIQSVVYDGANTLATGGGSMSQTFGGFTVPAAPFIGQATAVVADGQLPGNPFSFAGSGPALNDPNAFPGKGPCPAGWSFGCLWDNNNYDVSSTFASGDTTANATIGVGTDCVTWVAQVIATGPSAAFANALATPQPAWGYGTRAPGRSPSAGSRRAPTSRGRTSSGRTSTRPIPVGR